MKLISETMSLRKGTWSPEEDQMLVAYIKRYGIWNWSLMPKAAGLSRSGKSCRLRWMNYLSPTVKRGRFSIEEIKIVTKLQESLGNKWSKIAEKMPGRTDNDIKNLWNSHLRKWVSSNIKTMSDGSENSQNDLKRIKQGNKKTREIQSKESCPLETEYFIAESFSLSEESNSFSEVFNGLETSCSTFEVKHVEIEGNILTEPFMMEPYIEEPYWRLQDIELTIQESYINDEMNSYWFEMYLEDYRMGVLCNL